MKTRGETDYHSFRIPFESPTEWRGHQQIWRREPLSAPRPSLAPSRSNITAKLDQCVYHSLPWNINRYKKWLDLTFNSFVLGSIPGTPIPIHTHTSTHVHAQTHACTCAHTHISIIFLFFHFFVFFFCFHCRCRLYSPLIIIYNLSQEGVPYSQAVQDRVLVRKSNVIDGYSSSVHSHLE